MTSGVGTNCFQWGTPFTHGGSPNQLIFSGDAFASVLGGEFSLGTLSYHNGTIYAGTEAASVDLQLMVNFTNPAATNQTSSFLVNLLSTPNNTGTAAGDADYVFLPSSFETQSFTVGGVVYDFSLTGFRNVVGDGFLSSSATEFHVIETGTASAQLYGRVTARNIPEPGTFALALLAVPAIVGLRRRKG